VSVIFISDLHLCAEQEQTLALFSQFLRDYRQASQLYILGDLLEAWSGDDYHDPALLSVINALTQYTRHTPTYFIHGNRDFLIGERFAKETGCQLLPELSVVDFGGLPLLIMHGDTLCSDDVEYQKFRQLVHSPEWRNGVLAMDIESRLQLARRYRLDSSANKAMKADDIMDVNQQTVERVMQEYGVQILLHGHTHRPGTHQFMLNQQTMKRYVLGDWTDQAIIAIVETGGEPKLEKIRLRG